MILIVRGWGGMSRDIASVALALAKGKSLRAWAEALVCWFGCEEKNGKARVPQVRSGYCAEAPVRYRSYTSRPAISEVVTRDGGELYNRGDRSSMTAFGAVLRGAGRGFFVRCGSRILRGGGCAFWLGDAQIDWGIALGSMGRQTADAWVGNGLGLSQSFLCFLSKYR